MKWKEKNKREKIRMYITVSIICIFVFLGIFAGIIFPNSQFAAVIENSVGKFFDLFSFLKNNYVIILETVTILVFMWIIMKLLRFLVTVLMKKGSRSATVGNLLVSIITYVSIFAAVFLILSAWGVETKTLLAGAGIIGLALSFGAQSLIEDVICGLFLIFEKQFAVNDVVQIGDFRGTVIEIGIRTTKFEDINGDIKIMNNSDIRGAINSSQDLSPAICDISISYSENIERVEEIIVKSLDDMKKKIPEIKEGPHYRGVQKLADSSVVLRIYAKTHEDKKYQVVRDLNREMKILFDKYNIQIPFPQLVIHQADEKQE